MCDQEEEYFSSEEEESEEEDDDDEWRKTPMFQRIKKAGHVSFSGRHRTYCLVWLMQYLPTYSL